jgi:hypothetical protein
MIPIFFGHAIARLRSDRVGFDSPWIRSFDPARKNTLIIVGSTVISSSLKGSKRMSGTSDNDEYSRIPPPLGEYTRTTCSITLLEARLLNKKATISLRPVLTLSVRSSSVNTVSGRDFANTWSSDRFSSSGSFRERRDFLQNILVVRPFTLRNNDKLIVRAANICMDVRDRSHVAGTLQPYTVYSVAIRSPISF